MDDGYSNQVLTGHYLNGALHSSLSLKKKQGRACLSVQYSTGELRH
jgi:hypothetical protein